MWSGYVKRPRSGIHDASLYIPVFKPKEIVTLIYVQAAIPDRDGANDWRFTLQNNFPGRLVQQQQTELD
jgi:hypothetical protein